MIQSYNSQVFIHVKEKHVVYTKTSTQMFTVAFSVIAKIGSNLNTYNR